MADAAIKFGKPYCLHSNGVKIMKTTLSSLTLAALIAGSFSLPLLAKVGPGNLEGVETQVAATPKGGKVLLAEAQGCFVNGNDVNVRKSPSKSATIIRKLNRGDAVQVYEWKRSQDGNWGQISDGWVLGKYLTCH